MRRVFLSLQSVGMHSFLERNGRVVYVDGQQSLLSAPSKKIGECNCGMQIGAREKTEQGDV